MKLIYSIPCILLSVCLCSVVSCNGQTKQSKDNLAIVGGGCDGCELMFVGMPRQIDAIDTSAGWFEAGQKMIVSGTIFKVDGKTPAADVVIYYWQTDNDGLYSASNDMNRKALRHGHIRGWVKTDDKGAYKIFTVRPAPYPNRSIASHIHLSIKEPDISNEYYVDEINFDDDPLLPAFLATTKIEKRGGSGVVKVTLKDSLQIAERNIILGLNIPNYPANK